MFVRLLSNGGEEQVSNYHVKLSGGLATAFWRRAEGAATHPQVRKLRDASLAAGS
jgi:hypothetical protein